ncbi:hypothetical protein RUND412_010373, partial [Rhizina undulata]
SWGHVGDAFALVERFYTGKFAKTPPRRRAAVVERPARTAGNTLTGAAGNQANVGGNNHSGRVATPDPPNATNGSFLVKARNKRSRRAKIAGPFDTSSWCAVIAVPSNAVNGGSSVGARKNPFRGTVIAGPSNGANPYYDDDKTDSDSGTEIEETLRKPRLRKARATPCRKAN